jgi:hypothetical protein
MCALFALNDDVNDDVRETERGVACVRADGDGSREGFQASTTEG